MRFFKFSKQKEKKLSKREIELLNDYNLGKVLIVDGKMENKAYFKSLEEKDGTSEVTE